MSEDEISLEEIDELRLKAMAKHKQWEMANDKVGLFHPYDKQAQFLNSKAKIVVFLAGNRSGKTAVGMANNILYALGRHPVQIHKPPVVIWVVSIDFTNHVKSVLLPTFFEWCPENEIKQITKDPPMVEFKNGSVIFFKSSDSGSERFQGAKIHLLHIDEEIKPDVVEECQARLIDYAGLMRVTVTPVRGAHWVKELTKKPNVEVIRANMLDNPHIDEASANEFLDGLPPDMRKTRASGDFLALSGIIYPEHLDGRYWVNPHEYPIHRDANIIFIMDTGFRVTACLWIEVKPDDSLVVFQEYYGKERSVIENASAISKMELHIRPRITQRLIDPASSQRTTSHNSAQDQYRNEGINCEHAQNDVLAGIFEVKNYMNFQDNGEPRIKFWNTLKHLREEFGEYIWADPGSEDVEKPRKGNDHVQDCHDAETEVLTYDGWKLFKDIDDDMDAFATVDLKTNQIEYQFGQTIKRKHKGDMVKIRGNKQNALVTPNHRMVVYPRDKTEPVFRLAKDLKIWDRTKLFADFKGVDVGEYMEIPRMEGAYRNVDKVNVMAFSSLMGIYVADGCCVKYKKKGRGYQVHFSMKKQRKRDFFENVIKELPFHFCSSPNGYYTSNMQLWHYIKEKCGSGCYKKKVPEFVRFSTHDVIRNFVDGAMQGDGWKQNGAWTYVTVSKELADGMQELLIKLGVSASCTIGKKAGTHKIHGKLGETKYQWWVREWKCKHGVLRGSKNTPNFKTVQYDGMVYCATVPNGTLITRRHGKPIISGNCLRYGVYEKPVYRSQEKLRKKWVLNEIGDNDGIRIL